MAIVVEVLLLVLAIGMASFAGARIADPWPMSPWLLPLIVGVAMALVACALVAGEIRRRLSGAGAVEQPAGGAGSRGTDGASPIAAMAGWLAMSCAYAIATPIVGFEIATFVFLTLALRVYARARWLIVLAVASGMAVLAPLVFRHVFLTMVP